LELTKIYYASGGALGEDFWIVKGNEFSATLKRAEVRDRRLVEHNWEINYSSPFPEVKIRRLL
jgi:hypothetical protein